MTGPWGTRGGLALMAIALSVLALFYTDRIFAPFPLYAGDEGSYLARSIHRLALVQRPDAFPQLLPISNTIYLRLLHVVSDLSTAGLEWVRLIGLAAYLAGLVLLYRTFGGALPGPEGIGLLLLALCFPYYRFVVTAMPEGIYILILCVVVAGTARLAPRHPLLLALLGGAGAAVLTLTKSQGVVLLPALAALLVIQGALARHGTAAVLLRLVALPCAFVLSGAAIQAVAGINVANPFRFFIGEAYDVYLRAVVARPEGPFLAALGLLGMVAAMLLLAAPPLLGGLWGICGSRWSSLRRARPLDGQEAAFVLLVFLLAGTVAMVMIFTWRMSFMPSETRRLWGRYFEFLVPMIWLAGAPWLATNQTGRARRMVLGGAVLLGLAGLGAVLTQRVVTFPWDASALSVFYRPDPSRWPFLLNAPYLKLAIAATLALLVAVVSGIRPIRAWGAYFAVLALIATHYDRAWHRDIAVGRNLLAAELPVAAALATAPAGQVAIVTPDPNAGFIAFLALQGRADVLPWVPIGPITGQDLARFRQVVVLSAENLPAEEWQEIFAGRAVSVFERR